MASFALSASTEKACGGLDVNPGGNLWVSKTEGAGGKAGCDHLVTTHRGRRIEASVRTPWPTRAQTSHSRPVSPPGGKVTIREGEHLYHAQCTRH